MKLTGEARELIGFIINQWNTFKRTDIYLKLHKSFVGSKLKFASNVSYDLRNIAGNKVETIFILASYALNFNLLDTFSFDFNYWCNYINMKTFEQRMHID